MNLPTLPSAPPPGTVKDLVCGMDVDPARTKHSTSHDGKDYFFCSAGCLEKFRRDPGKYLSGGGYEAMESASPAPAAKGALYTCPMHPEIVRPGPGSCPICGMALEPRTISLEDAPNPELVDMKRRLRVAVVLTAPLLFFEMGRWWRPGLATAVLADRQPARATAPLDARRALGGLAVLPARMDVDKDAKPEHVHPDRPRDRRGVRLQRLRRRSGSSFPF